MYAPAVACVIVAEVYIVSKQRKEQKAMEDEREEAGDDGGPPIKVVIDCCELHFRGILSTTMLWFAEENEEAVYPRCAWHESSTRDRCGQ